MIDGPIKQDAEYVEEITGEIYTVLSGTQDDALKTTTVLEVLGTELPCVVYYSTANVTKTIVVSETDFRQRFKEVDA